MLRGGPWLGHMCCRGGRACLRWRDVVAETLEDTVEGCRSAHRKLLFAMDPNLHRIDWSVVVVSEDEENSDPKAEERRPGKGGDRASWRARPVSLDRA